MSLQYVRYSDDVEVKQPNEDRLMEETKRSLHSSGCGKKYLTSIVMPCGVPMQKGMVQSKAS